MSRRAERLVQDLINRGILHDKRLIRAFLEVPLEKFIPKELTDERRLYQDIPQLFYFRPPNLRRTISAPHMICIMLESLCIEEKDNLLILGSKSGYIEAMSSHLCPAGEIIIVESIKELVDITRKNLDATGFGKNITITHRNVVYGLRESGPWQKILVTGQVEKEDLDYVIYQLDPNGGMLFAPIGPPFKQDFTQIIRDGDDFYYKKLMEVIFGPLDLYEPTTPVGESTPPEISENFQPIQFKIDLGIIDNRIRNMMNKYLVKEQGNEKYSDEEILSASFNSARKNSGFINILEIADQLDIAPEDIIRVLKKSEEGVVEDFGTSNIANTIFILKEEAHDKINQSIEKINKILEDVNEMKNEYKLETANEDLNNIDKEIEELREIGPESIYGIRKLKNLLNSIRSNIILLTRMEEKFDSNSEILEKSKSITKQQFQELEELADLLKILLKRLKNWLN